MTSIRDLEKEIEKIKKRNKRVEADKAWEISWMRRIFVAFSTYVLILILMFSIKVDKPFLASLIPTVAYLISTVSLGFLKSKWLKEISER